MAQNNKQKIIKMEDLNLGSCCRRCFYLVPDPDGLGVRCAAYPFGKIPKKFINGLEWHYKIEGDQTGECVCKTEVRFFIK